jgi:hypothetical protein
MNRDHSSEEEPSTSSSAPLFSIGFAVLAVLLVPIFLYSVGPGGPIRVGDIVFVTDRYRVPMVNSDINGEQTQVSTCFLEPRVQLVVQRIGIPAEDVIIAEPIAIEKSEQPACPPRMPVVLHPHQVTLKADIWGGLRDTLSRFFSGS